MATIRKGSQSVLLVVDVQVGVMQQAWEAERVVANVAAAVEKARNAHVPVIWVRHSDEELLHGSLDWQLVPDLKPAADEPVIDKNFNSSFEETELEKELARLGATHIVLAGAATNWCIRATAYAALDRGYDLTLLKDAHTTVGIEDDGVILVAAKDIVRDLNVAMAWLSYPGRANNTVAAAEVATAFQMPVQ